MDAKERHELKDNDLAEFLENFGVFWDKHGNRVTVFFLIVVLGWFGLKYYNSMQANRHENAWADLASTTTPQGFRERAKENQNYDSVHYLALIRGAEAFHEQAIKLEDEGADPTAGGMSAKDSLDSAQTMYKQVLDSPADTVYRANAAVGLANVLETRGDFDAAKGYWTQAQSIAEGAGLGAIAAQAKVRLTLLDELAKPIIFDESQVSAVSSETPTESDTATPDQSATPDASQTPAEPG